MHTVEQLEQALTAAREAGYRIRSEWLGGGGGGDCEIKGQRWIFLDLANSPDEQLEQVLAALQRIEPAATLPMQPELEAVLRLRKSA